MSIIVMRNHVTQILFYFQYGTTPLIWACRKGHAEIVDMLLADGAVVDKAGMVSKTWFAFSCYAFDHLGVVILKLEEIADPSANSDG